MREYFKFPSTKHIILPDDENARKDKVLSKSEIEILLSNPITLEEKVDGANLGISFDDDGGLLLQNRGNWITEPYEGQWSKLKYWIDPKLDAIFEILLNKYILFGEWCYAKHSIYYNKLPDWFIGFDIYDKESEKFLSVEKRDCLLEKMKICIVHKYGMGNYTLEELVNLRPKSSYGDVICEGIYLRWDEGEWLKQRAKLVQKNFRQNIDQHWTKGGLIKNKLFQS